jgi:hypothetical protein
VKRLVNLLLDFIRHDFHFRTFALVILWAAVLLILNYSIDLENDVIDSLPTNGMRFLGYLTLYATTYYSTIYIIKLSKPKSEFTVELSKKFWLISGLGIIIFSADSGFVFYQYIVDAINPKPRLYNFYFAVLSDATEFITIAFPLFLVNFYLISNRSDNLGINERDIHLKPFFIILLIIAPFIFFSAFESGLNNYYPTFRHEGVAKVLGIAEWIPVALYELFYGLDFFNVELMFRGFMVIGLISYLGRDAVLPMAVIYCSIHFGKPPVEAISSLFGGYVLGAIAYQTRSVWGGVIVHMGLAWLMELSAFLVKGYLLD